MKVRLFTMLVATTVLAFQAAESPIGHVIRSSGNWQDERKQGAPNALKKGSAIWKDSKVKIDGKPEQGDNIEIRFYSDNQPRPFSCLRHVCSDPLDLASPVSSAETSAKAQLFLRGLGNVLSELAKSEHSPSLSGYARALSKGGESPKDGVVSLTGGSVNLDPLFEGMKAGPYRLELCPIGLNGSVSCPAGVEPTTWTLGREASLYSQSDLRAGLYELRLFAQTESGLSRVGAAPGVLLTSPDKLATQKRLFEDAAAAVVGWTPAESSMALRAYLQSLAISN